MADIVVANGGPYDLSSVSRPADLTISTLSYQPSTVLPDGSLYEGQWNADTNEPEGLGVKIATDGSLFECVFKNGRANGQGRKINNSDKEIYTGSFVNDLR